MSQKTSTIVHPQDLLRTGVSASAKEMAEVFLRVGLADSMEQAEYLAAVHEMDLGFCQFHAAMAVGRLAGANLNPVDMASDDFINLYNSLANQTLRQMSAQGSA